jgi:hypothetical protein
MGGHDARQRKIMSRVGNHGIATPENAARPRSGVLFSKRVTHTQPQRARFKDVVMDVVDAPGRLALQT